MGIADTPDWTTDSADLAGPGAEKLADAKLRQRLASLSDRHPSGPGYPDVSPQLPETGDPDREHAEHIVEVRTALADAAEAGLTSDRLYTKDEDRSVWSADRAANHEEIVDDLYARAENVPCDGIAILAGGLPGAGKTTVLAGQAGLDLSRYLILNPDEIKEEMARRGMVPEVPGLSPMEACDLVHEESSHVAKQLASRAYSEGKNVIWDITMSSIGSTMRRIADLREVGYADVEGIFVDVPLETCVRRADGRYREGQADYLAGRGEGGRFVDPDAIWARVDNHHGSTSRRAFEQVKPALDRWRLFDNSADGGSAVLVDQSLPRDDPEWEATR